MIDLTALFIGLFSGVIVGGLLAWFWAVAHTRSREQQERLHTAERAQRAESLVAEFRRQADDATRSLDQVRNQLSDVQQARAAADTRYTEAVKNLETQKQAMTQAREELLEAFHALSGEALQRNNEVFLNLAKSAFQTIQVEARGDLSQRQQAIDELVKPLQENLVRYEAQLRHIEESRREAYGGIDQHLRILTESQQRLQQEANNLVNALRSPTVRGRWGEITLKRVAELAGMVSHCDFVEQEIISGDHGRLRPDMVVQLPGGRRIIVDAKAVLSAYLEAMEATQEVQRQELLRRHADQIRSRLDELSLKAYWNQFDQAPEFVVLFLPGEQFLGAALEQDPSLIEDGFSRGVVVATPTTLMALLRAVAYGWRQEQLNAHAQEAGRLGKDLYERMAVLAEHLNDIGLSLGKSVVAYNKAVGSLESRILPAARKFKELGVATDREVPGLEPVDSLPRTRGTLAAEELGASYDR